MGVMQQCVPCPFLPIVDEVCDYRILQQHGARRDAGFYVSALQYAQQLWCDCHAGRALLAATRALYADLAEGDEVLSRWPLPYAALAWMMRHHDSDDFPGNPRLSYQHQATRLRGSRAELRSARAWAVWALACAARPSLPGDNTCPEWTHEQIIDALKRWGHGNEVEVWENALHLLAGK
jgi:hypothetical protein